VNALSSIQRLFLLAIGLMIFYLVLTRVPVLSSWLPEAKWWKAALGLLFGTITLIWYLRAQRSRHD
jgi:membrane associated rhomboid family serine protease